MVRVCLPGMFLGPFCATEIALVFSRPEAVLGIIADPDGDVSGILLLEPLGHGLEAALLRAGTADQVEYIDVVGCCGDMRTHLQLGGGGTDEYQDDENRQEESAGEVAVQVVRALFHGADSSRSERGVRCQAPERFPRQKRRNPASKAACILAKW